MKGSTLMLVGLGGFGGAVTRYLLSVWLQSRIETGFPWSTLIINVTGCFLIGIAMARIVEPSQSPNLHSVLVVGFLGGYTTFSAFSWETLQLIQNGRLMRACLYVLGSAVLSVAATWAGLLLTRAVAR